LARLLTDLPAGFFIAHHLRRALWLGPLALAAGLLLIGTGGPAWTLIAGRFLLGVGHSFNMLAGITLIIRHARPERQSMSLNAFEMTGMLGVLGGIVVAGLLPPDWSWRQSLLVASSPQLIVLLLLPGLLARLPADFPREGPRRRLIDLFRPPGPAAQGVELATPRQSLDTMALLGLAAGTAIALSWSSIGTFLLPLRADRDFGLEREGVALLTALPQLVDVIVLLPFGVFADRMGRVRVLACAMVVMAIAVSAITFGGVSLAFAGAVLLGLALAGWMLPISLINRVAPPEQIAWRAGLYRLSVDAGVFLGPLVTGFVVGRVGAWPVGLGLSAMLLALGFALFRARHR
jgi:MFS family permease